eukprot:15333434-Ditylum_brightwellii.AAC.1
MKKNPRVKAKMEYTYGTERFDYIVGKQWPHKVHDNKLCIIPYTANDKLEERILKGFNCDFILKTLPAGPDCNFWHCGFLYPRMGHTLRH